MIGKVVKVRKRIVGVFISLGIHFRLSRHNLFTKAATVRTNILLKKIVDFKRLCTSFERSNVEHRLLLIGTFSKRVLNNSVDEPKPFLLENYSPSVRGVSIMFVTRFTI